MNRFFLKFLLAVLFLINIGRLQAYKLGDYLDLSDCITAEAQWANPLQGAVMWEFNLLKNMFRYGPESSAPCDLVRQLFVDEGGSFGISHNEKLLAANLSPECIGHLVGLIYTEKNKFLEDGTTVTIDDANGGVSERKEASAAASDDKRVKAFAQVLRDKVTDVIYSYGVFKKIRDLKLKKTTLEQTRDCAGPVAGALYNADSTKKCIIYSSAS